MTARIKSWLFFIILCIASGIIVLGMVILNNNVTKIGIVELNGFLNDVNREESNIDYLGMVSKFKLQMDLYRDTIDQHEKDKKELRVAMAISSYSDSLLIYNRENFTILTDAVMFVINLFRVILDKPALSLDSENLTDNDLTLAYYYERNYYYDKALDIYDRTLKNTDSDEKKIPIILIHKAFCLALTGRMDEARALLKAVIEQYTNENAAFTAALLLQYIIFFQQEIDKTKASDASDLEKSEKLYKLIAYDDAIEILDSMLVQDEEQKDKIQYLKARCYEETGEKEKAYEIYQEIIEEDGDSEIAELSNNRMLIIGILDKQLERLKELAEENNRKIQSDGFSEILEVTDQYEETADESFQDALIEREIEKGDEDKPGEAVETFVEKAVAEIKKKEAEPTAAVQPTPVNRTATPRGTAGEGRTPVPEKTVVSEITPVPVQTPPPNLDQVKTEKEDGSYLITHKSKEGISFKIDYYSKAGVLQYYIEYIYDYDGKIVGVVKKDDKGNIID